jgi:hypothetical protein
MFTSATFRIYADCEGMTFAIKMSEYCPHQPWLMQEMHGQRLIKYVSNGAVSGQTEWEIDHPFRRIGKYLASFPTFPHDIREYYNTQWYCKAQRYHFDVKDANCGSFQEMIADLDGWIYITTAETEYDRVDRLPLKWYEKSVVTFVWLPPWAINEFRRCKFIELDTSFRALKPYVYAIPMGICGNEGLP